MKLHDLTVRKFRNACPGNNLLEGGGDKASIRAAISVHPECTLTHAFINIVNFETNEGEQENLLQILAMHQRPIVNLGHGGAISV